MAENLDLRCVLVTAPWVLGSKHVSNPEQRRLRTEAVVYKAVKVAVLGQSILHDYITPLL